MSILYIIVIKRARGNFIVFIIRLQGEDTLQHDVWQGRDPDPSGSAPTREYPARTQYRE